MDTRSSIEPSGNIGTCCCATMSTSNTRSVCWLCWTSTVFRSVWLGGTWCCGWNIDDHDVLDRWDWCLLHLWHIDNFVDGLCLSLHWNIDNLVNKTALEGLPQLPASSESQANGIAPPQARLQFASHCTVG